MLYYIHILAFTYSEDPAILELDDSRGRQSVGLALAQMDPAEADHYLASMVHCQCHIKYLLQVHESGKQFAFLISSIILTRVLGRF